jgi:ArsR family transcriptional regulator, virulence genes transcriptional regulator
MDAKESSELHIEILSIQRGLKIFSGINSQLRQEMLGLIHKNGRMTVTQLFTELNLEQPIASNHLAILRNAEIVTSKRIGKNVFYSINYSRLKFLHFKSDQLLELQKGPAMLQ